ncbi:MAG: homocysteine S-methyltransferase family protein, partial [Clostridiales bacterium]
QLASGKTLIFDGAMGSLLASLGAGMQSGHHNLNHPDLVEKAHRYYIDAGADCIITNSFSLNRIYSQLTDDQLDTALHASMEIALKAADDKIFVFGDIGPTGQMLAPYGKGNQQEFYEAYCRQIETMKQYPLSGLIVETIFHLPEAEIILQACQDIAPELPRLLSMTFYSNLRGGLTMMGNKATDIAALAKKAGCAAVGGNCGDLNPEDYPPIIATLQQAGLPILLQPNAGKPQIIDEQTVYPLNPEQFSAQMAICQQAGVQMLGGCCGTTPEHIRQLVKLKQ